MKRKNIMDWCEVVLMALLVWTTVTMCAAMQGAPLLTTWERPWVIKYVDASTRVTATVYHAVSGECDSDPLTTAGMYRIGSAAEAYGHRYIAVSRDLLPEYPYGTEVEITGAGDYDGRYIVADTMHPRYTDHVDILISTGMAIGKWEDVQLNKVWSWQ